MTAARPVALLLTPVLPSPCGCGRAMRAWNWLLELARDHQVHVLVAGDDATLPVLPEDYPARAVWPIGQGLEKTAGLFRLAGWLCPFLALFTRRVVTDWRRCVSPDASLDALRAHLNGLPVRRVVVFRLYLHDVGRAVNARIPCDRLDLDMDDLESDTRMSVALALLRLGRYAEAALSVASALQYRLIERSLTEAYRSVWLAAPEDGARIARRPGQTIACRPNCPPAPPDGPSPSPSGISQLLFVGTLDYPPNEEAALYLVERILPELRARARGPWLLNVVGRNPSRRLRAVAANDPGIVLRSDVDDLAPLYAAAHIVLVPLRSGGGTKLKTLEGFAHRRPVVSTRHGVRGLGAVAGEHFLSAEKPAEFVEAIMRLGEDRALAERVAEEGWRHYWLSAFPDARLHWQTEEAGKQ
jgi:glycosyltransferase involved in cell wall biosynthesis